jgi:arginine exporter protein ArgO
MSDLQIVTGLSILISGFSQLHCGLSTYHWQVLVYLAWFSSLTHLCCLTFLRNYLFNHPGQRLWRLVSMFVIVLMLVVALVPTGYFDWFHSYQIDESMSPSPSSYAVNLKNLANHRIVANLLWKKQITAGIAVSVYNPNRFLNLISQPDERV